MRELSPAPAPPTGERQVPVALHGARTHPVVDVVVPVFDEERALEPGIRRLHTYLHGGFPFSWRITIVDNASTDGTWAQARHLADELDGVVAVHLDRKGRGLALRSAWTASDADVVAYMDVDLSTDLDALLPLVAPLVSGHSDVAIGSRLAPGSHVARHPKREFISRCYNLLLRTVLATRVRDAQCGFKAVRASVARRLVPAIEDDCWFFDTELLLLAERNGLRIHEVPVDWVDDTDSRVHVVSTAIGDLKGAARMIARFASGTRSRGSRTAGPSTARQRLRSAFRRLHRHRRREHGRVVGALPPHPPRAGIDRGERRRGHRDLRRQRVGARAVYRGPVAPALGSRSRALRRFVGRDEHRARVRRRIDRELRRAGRGPRLVVVARRDGAVRRDRPAVVIAGRGDRRVVVSLVRRMSRCFLVSVGTTLLSAGVLVVLALGAGVPAGPANVVAVGCGIVPSYLGNRRWVWGRTGRSDLAREVAPFWVLSVCGLVASTVAVSAVASATAGWSTSARSIALPLANLTVFGALWLAQFALLDRVLFRVVPNEPVLYQSSPREHAA